MRVLRILLEKEFRQIFRNTIILRIIFMMPAIQLIIMPLAADYEVKEIKLSIVDLDHSTYSQRLISKVTATHHFSLVDYAGSYREGLRAVENDEADLLLQIPSGFERSLVRENRGQLYMAINAINGVKAGLGGAYLGTIIQDFNGEIRTDWITPTRMNPSPVIRAEAINWYNPLMNYKVFMVPGILVILVTMVGGFLSALNIVNEKETGTIEQINVTPIRKYQFILGKLIPFWILGLVVLTIGLTIARVIYGIYPVGSFLTIYTFAAIYLLAVLGLGLLISTLANNQQQAMLLSFFMMMVFILLGGLFSSVESMPRWAQVFTWFNPVAYFIEVMRMVILKGSSLGDIRNHLGIVFLMAVVLNSLAVLNYRKRS